MTHGIITTCLLALMFAWPMTAIGQEERYRLYTKPDPTCAGGIKGVVTNFKMPIVQALAIPPDEPRLVYEGTLTGSNSRGFLFRGLPMRKYDLVLIYDNRFYEGLRLNRGENTLTEQDIAHIDEIIQKSEPYFTVKVIHRLEGKTGDGQLARCICTFLRNESLRRTFKLVTLKDVGIAWQVVRARDLYPLYVEPDRGVIKHYYSKSLEGIRVTDYLKDLGEIELSKVDQ